jgi:D-threo-aldose 1-dehydrogenase
MTLPTQSITTRANEKLSLTRLGLGTAPLGNIYRPIPEADSDTTLAAAWDLGIRYFDTAPYYGRGLAETRLNRFLRGRPRDDYVLSTKVGRLLQRIPPEEMVGHTHYFATPSRAVRYDYSRDGILRSVEHSLERLGVDRIDILLVHDIDPITHGTAEASEAHIRTLLDSGVKAFEELRRTGVARAFGTGLNVTETTARLVDALDLDVVLLAGRYTLLEQEPLRALFPLCQRKGTAVLAAGAFNSGLLAGGSTYNYKAAPPDLIERAKRIEAVCRSHGVALKDAALRFPLLHPVVAGVVFGAVTAAEVHENIASLSRSIPDALWRDLKSAGLLDVSAPS